MCSCLARVTSARSSTSLSRRSVVCMRTWRTSSVISPALYMSDHHTLCFREGKRGTRLPPALVMMSARSCAVGGSDQKTPKSRSEARSATPWETEPLRRNYSPPPTQERRMDEVLWRCRTLCNTALEQRKTAWERCHVSVRRVGRACTVMKTRRGIFKGGTAPSGSGSTSCRDAPRTRHPVGRAEYQ